MCVQQKVFHKQNNQDLFYLPKAQKILSVHFISLNMACNIIGYKYSTTKCDSLQCIYDAYDMYATAKRSMRNAQRGRLVQNRMHCLEFSSNIIHGKFAMNTSWIHREYVVDCLHFLLRIFLCSRPFSADFFFTNFFIVNWIKHSVANFISKSMWKKPSNLADPSSPYTQRYSQNQFISKSSFNKHYFFLEINTNFRFIIQIFL